MTTNILGTPFYCGIALLLCVLSNNGFAIGQTTRVSVGLGGANPNGGSVLGIPHSNKAISANGRFVAFQSSADNLVVGDTNHDVDMFVYDRLTKKTTRVNVASNGEQASCPSCPSLIVSPSISSDGRYAVFVSKANNLVAGDTNSAADIFVHDLRTKQTTRVSINSKGEQAAVYSTDPSISADGRYVVFGSAAGNLVARDTNSMPDIFVHDRLTKQTTRVSVSSTGLQADLDSYLGSISADGRYVVFVSQARNLVANDTNVGFDVFVHDRQTKQTSRVNVNSKGEEVYSDSSAPNAKISADGRYVAFVSGAANLVLDDTNHTADVFVRDLQTKQTTRVSVNSNNGQGQKQKPSSNPDISADGRFIVFTSHSSLSTNDKNNGSDVYIHDRLSHQTSLISVDFNGSLAANTGDAFFTLAESFISADGSYVAFQSFGNNLVVGDTSVGSNVFVRDRKFSTTNPTDLQIAVTQKPTTLVRNSQGSYTYTITNNGQSPAYTTITHLVSNGEVVGFTPAKGKCNSYASISFCNLDLLLPGASVTLGVSVKALRTPISQQLTLASGGRDDPNKTNNYLTVNTPVTP